MRAAVEMAELAAREGAISRRQRSQAACHVARKLCQKVPEMGIAGIAADAKHERNLERLAVY